MTGPVTIVENSRGMVCSGNDIAGRVKVSGNTQLITHTEPLRIIVQVTSSGDRRA